MTADGTRGGPSHRADPGQEHARAAAWLRGARPLLLLSLLVLASCSAAGQDKPPHPVRAAPPDVADPRLADPYLRHVVVLADEKMGGRPTWGPERVRARDYVLEQLFTAGFARLPRFDPAGGRQVYVQEFQVPIERLGPGNMMRCKFTEDRTTTIHIGKIGRTFLPLNASASGQAEGAVLFVGFGMAEDYRELVVENKIVFSLDGLPRELRDPKPPEGATLPEGARPVPDPRGEPIWKAAEARRRGAAGFVLLVPDPAPPSPGAAPGPLETPAAAWVDHLPARVRARVDTLEGEQTNYTALHAAVGMQARQVRPEAPLDLPCAAAPTSLAARILNVDASALDGAIRSGEPMRPISLPRTETLLSVAIETTREEGSNVLAFLPGDDAALRDEAILVGAHYDHLGRDGTDHHFPGALDNASGIAALLECARALAASFPKPRRSVIFAAFAGEEWGLWGSKAFCAAPPVSIERVMAMINLDMVGTDQDRQCYVLGPSRSPRLFERLVAANAGAGLLLKTNLEFAFAHGSDHWPFHRQGVPALMLTTSRYPEYHTRKDLPDLVSRDMIDRVTRLVGDLVRELAAGGERFPRPREFEMSYPQRKK